jgi:hypothetical protein
MSPTGTQRLTAALSGPISKGDQEANLRAFEVARETLLSEGHPAFPAWAMVHTPLANPGALEAARESAGLIAAGEDYRNGPLYRQAVRWYFVRILHSDVLFMLPGWLGSNGARGEAWLAAQCGIEVRDWADDPAGRALVDDVDLRLVTPEETAAAWRWATYKA